MIQPFQFLATGEGRASSAKSAGIEDNGSYADAFSRLFDEDELNEEARRATEGEVGSDANRIEGRESDEELAIDESEDVDATDAVGEDEDIDDLSGSRQDVNAVDLAVNSRSERTSGNSDVEVASAQPGNISVQIEAENAEEAIPVQERMAVRRRSGAQTDTQSNQPAIASSNAADSTAAQSTVRIAPKSLAIVGQMAGTQAAIQGKVVHDAATPVVEMPAARRNVETPVVSGGAKTADPLLTNAEATNAGPSAEDETWASVEEGLEGKQAGIPARDEKSTVRERAEQKLVAGASSGQVQADDSATSPARQTTSEVSVESLRGQDPQVSKLRETEAQRSVVRSPIAQNFLSHVRTISLEPGTVNIRLKPQGLGLVEVEISKAADGQTEVSIKAKNPMVLEALRMERHAISDLLNQQGSNIRQEGLSFDLFGQQNTGGGKSPRDENAALAKAPGGSLTGEDELDEAASESVGSSSTSDTDIVI